MHIAISLAALLATGTAAAAPMDGDRWDAGAVERRGHKVLTTGLMFRRTGAGEWEVSARCETRDIRTGRWRAKTGRGVAVRSMGLVMVKTGTLGRFILFVDAGEIASNKPWCASGAANLGTGD
ncbi:hypothetical protein GOFOIKOB_0375 [Methylobacterium tardum]|jgi:hypothetical protein|uniref:Uncharacterized protein n=1 Tax=Methylobacterium tardum TaxID=374432 RepID=A0AA37THI9_9HYPH|nr:hypothetical protein [Methylobacterium tardum]URD36912.1 hypothetical protein M6G65_32240 [Methylobacterium tardum]GJE47354.1 hypothetical protein GOFOIKOB_0375 [Methylobacterium tardum]GLS71273.1 hypothetical protein GCM10007890_32860 [Methylobacterium tardum]